MSKPGAPSQALGSFRRGLREAGYIEGRNIVVEAHFADGSSDRADQMVIELVKSKADIIVAQGSAAWSAYRHAGTTPVVMGYSGDPVEARFVESLSHPGGPRTGMSWMQLELVGKRFELLAQTVPGVKRVAVIANPGHPGEQNEFRQSLVGAKNLGISLSHFPVRNVEELESAFSAISNQSFQAVVIFPDAVTLDQSEKIAAFGLAHRLPTVSGWDTFAENGVLLTYGPDLDNSYAHLATYVDKILKGANPADLPVELPTSVKLAVNLKTAKALGITIPQSIMVRADRVIE